MARAQKVIKVSFDKNMNLILRPDPVFSFLFPDILTLTSFKTFLAQNNIRNNDFTGKLHINGKEHHICYKCIDREETFDFEFFLLDEEWMIISPNGNHDTRDPLTGVLSTNTLLSLIEHELKSASRDKQSYTALIIDIAHLRDINETFGYLAGDTIIQTVGELLHENSRGCDPLGRYGGDKFVLILHQTGHTGALQFMEKFQKALESRRFFFSDINFHINVNMTMDSLHLDDTVDTLLNRLLRNLKQVKQHSNKEIEYSV